MKGIEMIYDSYLALGSNIGDREQNLRDALERLAKIEGIDIINRSNIYETEPVGYLDQARFLNMVILIKTNKTPVELLNNIHDIEEEMKRVREIHWGPRTIDIDILLFDDWVMNLPELVLPHPRMFERAFVLIPLHDILTEERLVGKDIHVLINACKDKNGVKLYRTGLA